MRADEVPKKGRVQGWKAGLSPGRGVGVDGHRGGEFHGREQGQWQGGWTWEGGRGASLGKVFLHFPGD